MARNRKRAEAGDPVGLSNIREMIRAKIIENHGSIAYFMKSDFGKSLGGLKIRTYLYDSGPTNFRILRDLCEHFGIGSLSKKEKIIRTVTYRLSK